jgi:hypothetical protein
LTYMLENLTPERFQALCQALLAKSYPNAQCFPVAQPDGGRDAIAYMRGSKGDKSFTVFQVKFNRNAVREVDPHKWLTDIMEDEAPKVVTCPQCFDQGL